jgi:Skp family chaperone for outer membrane proteins
MKGLYMMFSNRFFAIALLVSFGGLFAATVENANNTGVVASTGIKSDIPSYICVVDMEKLLANLQEEMQALQEKESTNFQKEMEASNKKREALIAKKADMDEAEFNRQMGAIETEIQGKAQAAQARMQKAQQDAQKRAEAIVAELKAFAEKKGIKVLLPAQGVLYFHSSCDVTAEAVEYVHAKSKKTAATTNKK